MEAVQDLTGPAHTKPAWDLTGPACTGPTQDLTGLDWELGIPGSPMPTKETEEVCVLIISNIIY